jgi:hypothetical protein
MIVCKDNFKHFGVFASLVKGLEPRTISPEASSCNMQFFTEYSLVESIFDSDTKRRLQENPTRKDTPDIMILLTAEPMTLIAIEAKMYDNPTDLALVEQMKAQREILDYLKGKLEIERVFHCALLPAKLAEAVGSLGKDVDTITWEKVLEAYQGLRDYEGDYFLETLRLALEKYDRLVSRAGRYGQNNKKKMTGQEISDGYNSGFEGQSYVPLVMGRNGGLDGDVLKNDIKFDGWKRHKYETNPEAKPPNDNWFPIKKLVDRVKEQRGREETD